MIKRQLIDEIRRYNPSAQPEFLGQFEEPDLQQYLDNLKDAQTRRQRITTYVHRQPKYRMVS